MAPKNLCAISPCQLRSEPSSDHEISVPVTLNLANKPVERAVCVNRAVTGPIRIIKNGEVGGGILGPDVSAIERT
jgi:hypothetical protein